METNCSYNHTWYIWFESTTPVLTSQAIIVLSAESFATTSVHDRISWPFWINSKSWIWKQTLDLSIKVQAKNWQNMKIRTKNFFFEIVSGHNMLTFKCMMRFYSYVLWIDGEPCNLTISWNVGYIIYVMVFFVTFDIFF